MGKIKYFCLLIVFLFTFEKTSAQLKDLNEDALFFSLQLESFKDWFNATILAETLRIDSLEIKAANIQLHLTITDSSSWTNQETNFNWDYALLLKDFIHQQFTHTMAIQADSAQIQYHFLPSYDLGLDSLWGGIGNNLGNNTGDSTGIGLGGLGLTGTGQGGGGSGGGFGDSGGGFGDSGGGSFGEIDDKPEYYRVLFVKGTVLKSNKILKKGITISSKDKIKFKSPDAMALVLGNSRGRFYLKPQKKAGNWQELAIFVSEVLIPIDHRDPLKVKKRLSVR